MTAWRSVLGRNSRFQYARTGGPVHVCHECTGGPGWYRLVHETRTVSHGERAGDCVLDDRHRCDSAAGDGAATLCRREAGASGPDRSVSVAGITAARVAPPQPALPAGLTEREVEVLRLAARGLRNKEIAEQLSISARTVGHHLAHIYDKTGRRTRTGASLFAVEHGLLHG